VANKHGVSTGFVSEWPTKLGSSGRSQSGRPGPSIKEVRFSALPNQPFHRKAKASVWLRDGVKRESRPVPPAVISRDETTDPGDSAGRRVSRDAPTTDRKVRKPVLKAPCRTAPHAKE
jgi:hypothetical protein